jgi:hypothetical protein
MMPAPKSEVGQLYPPQTFLLALGNQFYLHNGKKALNMKLLVPTIIVGKWSIIVITMMWQ